LGAATILIMVLSPCPLGFLGMMIFSLIEGLDAGSAKSAVLWPALHFSVVFGIVGWIASIVYMDDDEYCLNCVKRHMEKIMPLYQEDRMSSS
jgi:hypothetical protein